MELININDNIRTIIFENIEKLKNEYDTIEECIDVFIENIYTCIDDESTSNKELIEMIISVSFVDTIKMLIFRIKNGIHNDMDLVKFSSLKNIDDYDSLNAEISADPSTLKYMIANCYEFCNINYFGRINIFNKLSNTENRWLFKILNSHSTDLMTYKEVNLTDIIKHVSNEISYQEKNFSMDMSDSNVISIVGCIKSVIESCPSKISKKLLFDLGIIDYSVSKYLNSKILDDELLITRVDFYENYSVNEILFWLEDNDEFLKQAVWMLYSLYFDKSYGNIELSEDILNNDSTKQMKKKLA